MATKKKHIEAPRAPGRPRAGTGEFQAWCERMGFTYQAAADALGLSFSGVRKYGDGTRDVPPSIEVTMALLEAKKGFRPLPIADATEALADAIVDARKGSPMARISADKEAIRSALASLSKAGLRLCRS